MNLKMDPSILVNGSMELDVEEGNWYEKMAVFTMANG